LYTEEKVLFKSKYTFWESQSFSNFLTLIHKSHIRMYTNFHWNDRKNSFSQHQLFPFPCRFMCIPEEIKFMNEIYWHLWMTKLTVERINFHVGIIIIQPTNNNRSKTSTTLFLKANRRHALRPRNYTFKLAVQNKNRQKWYLSKFIKRFIDFTFDWQFECSVNGFFDPF
jgi:hypothetical protein